MYLGTKTWRIVAGAAALTLLLGACGDDDGEDADSTTTTEEAEEETTTTEAEEEDDEQAAGGDGVNPEFAEYCAAVAEVDQSEELPTPEQLEAIRAAAPDEISDEINTVVDLFLADIESGGAEDAFDDPALVEAFGPIEAFEAENCGTTE